MRSLLIAILTWGSLLGFSGCHTVMELPSAMVKFGASGLEKDFRWVRTQTMDFSTTIWLWTGETPRKVEE